MCKILKKLIRDIIDPTHPLMGEVYRLETDPELAELKEIFSNESRKFNQLIQGILMFCFFFLSW